MANEIDGLPALLWLAEKRRDDVDSSLHDAQKEAIYPLPTPLGTTLTASDAERIQKTASTRRAGRDARMSTVTITNTLKVYGAWTGDLGSYLQVGDFVDGEIYSHFLDVVFPACMAIDLLQMGEPSDHRGEGGAARYLTLQRFGNCWIYTGAQTLRTRVTLAPAASAAAGQED